MGREGLVGERRSPLVVGSDAQGRRSVGPLWKMACPDYETPSPPPSSKGAGKISGLQPSVCEQHLDYRAEPYIQRAERLTCIPNLLSSFKSRGFKTFLTAPFYAGNTYVPRQISDFCWVIIDRLYAITSKAWSSLLCYTVNKICIDTKELRISQRVWSM